MAASEAKQLAAQRAKAAEETGARITGIQGATDRVVQSIISAADLAFTRLLDAEAYGSRERRSGALLGGNCPGRRPLTVLRCNIPPIAILGVGPSGPARVAQELGKPDERSQTRGGPSRSPALA